MILLIDHPSNLQIHGPITLIRIRIQNHYRVTSLLLHQCNQCNNNDVTLQWFWILILISLFGPYIILASSPVIQPFVECTSQSHSPHAGWNQPTIVHLFFCSALQFSFVVRFTGKDSLAWVAFLFLFSAVLCWLAFRALVFSLVLHQQNTLRCQNELLKNLRE